MSKRMSILFLTGWFVNLLCFSLPKIQQEIPKESPAYPRVEIKDTELRTLKSKHVGQEYKINIFFPKDYEKGNKRYPVVYVLDAEYNFGCVAYIARRLIKNGDIPKILLVGIAYDTDYEDFYDKRFRDSTPESSIHGHNSGGAEQFTQFIEKELIPFVNQNFRTIPEDRTIVGHSITGFYCCYVLFQHPYLFDRYIIVSPSLWFSNGVVFEYEEAFASKKKDMHASVFLSVGEDESQRIREGSINLSNTMSKRGFPHLRFQFSLVEGENHRSLFPFAFSRGLRFVFSVE
jgi:predicted alpha/beta superfamily hydrolase